MMLIDFSLDLGAFGYGQSGNAVLKTSDSTKNLRDFTISSGLSQLKWINNKTISAKINIIPLIRKGIKFKPNNHVVNGIKIQVSAYDFIDKNDKLFIEHREISPNKKLELIAYRYKGNDGNLNFIHVSVIKKGKKIPKYGNYFIADIQSDYIFSGTWTKNNELKFYTNKQDKELVQYYMLEKRQNIPYKLVVDEKKFGDSYRWQ